MLDRLKEKVFGYTKVAGVEAILQSDGLCFNLVILEKVKNVISIVKTIEGIKNVEELVKVIPVDLPVSLCIQGKGVINRKIAAGTYSSELEVLSSVFPNAKADEFYLQQTHCDKSIFLSVTRQSTIKEINQRLTSSGISIVEVSIGPFGVQQLIPFFKNEPKVISLQGINLTVAVGKLDDFSNGNNVEGSILELGEDKINSNQIIPYANALSLFLQKSEESSIEVPIVKVQQEEYKQKLIFKVLGYGLLAFFVIVLLVNYLFYNYYKEDNARLGMITSSYQNTLEEVKKLEKKIEEKEYFMKKAGWLSIPKTSFYSDEIAASIPGSSIRLTGIKVNPLNDKLSNRERKDIFKTDTIFVSGTCVNPTALNPWMSSLKEKKWVSSLSNLNYTYDQKNRSGSFEIEIRVGDGR